MLIGQSLQYIMPYEVNYDTKLRINGAGIELRSNEQAGVIFAFTQQSRS
jgi:hypothetical protein